MHNKQLALLSDFFRVIKQTEEYKLRYTAYLRERESLFTKEPVEEN